MHYTTIFDVRTWLYYWLFIFSFFGGRGILLILQPLNEIFKWFYRYSLVGNTIFLFTCLFQYCWYNSLWPLLCQIFLDFVVYNKFISFCFSFSFCCVFFLIFFCFFFLNFANSFEFILKKNTKNLWKVNQNKTT